MIDGGGEGGDPLTPRTQTHTPRHAPASMSITQFGLVDRVTTEAIADYL